MTILVRDSNGGKQVGVDWRVVAAMGTLILALGTAALNLIQERYRFNDHVARGEPIMAEARRHFDNLGPIRHLDEDQARMIAALPWHMARIREDLDAIKRKLRISDDDVRIGAHVVPPGEDD